MKTRLPWTYLVFCVFGLGFLSPSTCWATLPTPSEPILVVNDSNSSDPYQNFISEMLVTEGLNEFQLAQLSDLTGSFLASYDVVILPHLTLTSAQATLFQNYVNAGGILIGFRPDKQLAALFGVSALGSTLQEGWIKIDVTTAYGTGLESQTLKFHGTADLYSLNTATTAATIYQDSRTSTPYPAVTINKYGTGQAILFSYDLTQTVVLIRQGNPAWAGYPNNHDGFTTMRPSQMFTDVNSSSFWNDFGDGTSTCRCDVPQADEQLRLLSNLLILTDAARRPLPRFWYFSNQNLALLLMTGDHHGDPQSNSVNEISFVQSYGGLFGLYLWYPFGGPGPSGSSFISPTTVSGWLNSGEEIGVHFDDTAQTDSTGISGSAVTWAGMQTVINNALASFKTTYPLAPAPQTTRDHYLIWVGNNALGNPDQTAQAKLFQSFGIQMDVSFSAFPKRWGYMTGSGLPMKFLDTQTGTVIPVYEQATQYEDDVQLSTSASALNWALPIAQAHYQQTLSDSLTKYHTAVTMLFHPDHWSVYQPFAQGALQYAQTNGIPIWSPLKWLTFWQARTATILSGINFASSTLSFAVNSAPSGLTVLIPDVSGSNVVSSVTVDGVASSYMVQSLMGIPYASVVLQAGNHTGSATYVTGQGISGQVIPNAAVSATTITLTGGPQGSASQSTTPAANGTYSFTLLPPGIYTVTPTVTPSGGGISYTPQSQSVTIAGADVTGVNFTGSIQPITQTLFTTQTPVQTNVSDGSSVNYELGTAFTSNVPGQATGIRFWKASSESGTHVGHLWTATGQLLASVTFTSETASGWQQQSLPAPVLIAANTRYVVSVNTGNTFYATTAGGLAQQVTNIHLSSVVGNNGPYGSPGQFPTNSWQNSSYFRDIVFTTGPTFLLAGTISPANAASGATVTLTGPSNGSTVVDATGSYSFSLPPGTYTVTPIKPGYMFTPTSQTVTLSSNDVTTVNFSVAVQTFSLSGTITGGGGSTVALSGAANASAAADSSGNYQFSGLTNGTYSVTPSKSGLVFSPVSQVVTISGTNVTGVNFTATAAGSNVFAISGTISPAANGTGVTVTLSGPASGAAITDSSGNYSFAGLPNGSYTVSPSKSGFSFFPPQSIVSVAGANVTGVNFTAAAQQTLFTSQTPTQVHQSDGANVNYELGTRFTSSVAGQISAIRFWKDSNETGTHVGHLWTASGQLLTSVTFANETASGWQVQLLPAPVSIAQNTVYVVSVNTGNTFYVDTPNGLASQVVNQNLSSVVGNNGVYGSPGQFTTNSWQNANYFRDVVFSGASSPTPFVLSGTVSPASDGNGTTVTLSGAAAGTTVADANGNYSFSGLPNGTYTVTPSRSGFAFTPASQSVTITGTGVAGVNFTASGVPTTLFTSQVPQTTGHNDGVSYELGTRFESAVPGQITAIRFWKDSRETGTHVGHIWSASGALLASVTFTNEAASGWQQQALATPLPISANAEYLVSVNTGAGYYVSTDTGFANQISNGSLFSIVGGNGRYGPPGQYPTITWMSSNYFRDVVFVAQ